MAARNSGDYQPPTDATELVAAIDRLTEQFAAIAGRLDVIGRALWAAADRVPKEPGQ